LTPGSELFRVLKQLAREHVSAAEARLVLRTPPRVAFEMPPVWEREHHWPFSHMEVFVYRKTVVEALVEQVSNLSQVEQVSNLPEPEASESGQLDNPPDGEAK